MEKNLEHRAVCPPLVGLKSSLDVCLAVKDVFADIEIEGRQILVAEVAKRPDVGIEIEIIDRPAELLVQFGGQVEHIALQLRHLLYIDLFNLAETGDAAEQIAEGIPELAVLVRDTGQDFLPDP